MNRVQAFSVNPIFASGIGVAMGRCLGYNLWQSGRQMISREDIEKVAKDIGEASKAECIILFGSHAKGSATNDSDVDLLVVAESDLPRYKRSRELYKSIRPHRFAMDIVVVTPEEMLRARQSRVSFVSQVLREGETVYVRG